MIVAQRDKRLPPRPSVTSFILSFDESASWKTLYNHAATALSHIAAVEGRCSRDPHLQDMTEELRSVLNILGKHEAYFYFKSES
jgi:hypothetical protein